MSKISKSEVSAQENRLLAQKPSLLKNNKLNEKYGVEFESYFNDRFNGRKQLLKLYSHLTEKYNFNGNSKVLKGKNGWLFYKLDNSLDNFQNKTLFTQTELQAIAKYLTDIHQWAENHGKKFYYVIAPDKNKIYGENIPVLKKIRPDSESRVRQLVNFLNENTSVKTIDLRENLLAKKDTGLLYYKEDTHWNDWGAYWGYIQIAKEMDITPLPYTQLLEIAAPDGDLLPMLGLKKSEDTSSYKRPIIEDKAICHYNGTIKDTVGEDLVCINKLHSLKVAMFRDSFTTAMKRYLNNTFGRIRYFWRYNITAEDLDYINQHADVIILEHVERSANLLTPLRFAER